jgi:dTDP-glucose 4,6-dehydratase
VYDEAKRFAEALSTAYRTARGVNVGIVRIFNTYGPRMSGGDGRIVTNFIGQALTGRALTVYGDGRQTRSFCYVDDLVRGIVAMIDCAEQGPVNLGNPEEFTVVDFAELIVAITGSASGIEYLPLPQDDPVRRRPVIDRAAERLNWKPEISVADGLRKTVEWFKSRPSELGEWTHETGTGSAADSDSSR